MHSDATRRRPPARRKIPPAADLPKDLATLLPLAGARRPLNGVEHPLVLHAVFEVGSGELLLVDALDEIENGMRERVLVADDMAGRPPRAGIGMLSVGDDHVAEAAVGTLFDVELELVHALEIEHQAAFAAVDLEAVVVLAPGGQARSLDAPDGVVLKTQKGKRGVVDVDGCSGFRAWERALGDERLEHAGPLGDLAHQVARQIERVRRDVAQGARPGLGLLEPPHAGKLGIDDPVLQVDAAVVTNGADAALVDDLLGQCDRRNLRVLWETLLLMPAGLDGSERLTG